MSNVEFQPGDIDEGQLKIVRRVLDRYRAWWPLSMKQVFYQSVKEGGAGLWLDEFGSFTRTVHVALVAGLLPLSAVSEERHESREGGAWEDTEEFLHSEIESFLWGYRRDLQQGQERYVEVWVQKPALMDHVSEAAVEYCATTVLCRRMPTAKFMEELRGRLAAARERSQQPAILFFGDFAPGETTFLSRVQDVLRTDGNLWEIEFRQEAVTADDAVKFDLPESVLTRARRRHGEPAGTVPVELEALPPDLLAERVRSAIESRLDMTLVNNQRAIQSREALRLGKLRTDLMRQMRSLLRQFMPRDEA